MRGENKCQILSKSPFLSQLLNVFMLSYFISSPLIKESVGIAKDKISWGGEEQPRVLESEGKQTCELSFSEMSPFSLLFLHVCFKPPCPEFAW